MESATVSAATARVYSCPYCRQWLNPYGFKEERETPSWLRPSVIASHVSYKLLSGHDGVMLCPARG